MTKAKPKYTPPPRGLDDYQLATRLNWGVSRFKKDRPKLEKEGFPKKDPLLGTTDSEAVERWYDSRSGIKSEDIDRDEWMEALDG